MSKYTTEVRFICEQKAGFKESQGGNKIDEILSTVWDKILYTKAPLYDESHREELFKKILKHYYFREICAETVGLWEVFINRTLEEVLPYFNQLYESAAKKFDIFNDVNEVTTHKGKGSRTGDNSTEGKTYSENTDTNKYSDTPQGGIDGVESGAYLTNASINNSSSEGTSNITEKIKDNTTDEYTRTVSGKRGGASYAAMLKEYRETILNIDMQVIDSLSDCFFNLW